MAFLQHDFPPSTAPIVARTAAPKRVRTAAPKQRSFTAGRLMALGVALIATVAPGYAAYAATESLALGFLASDFAFLIAIAAWSAVSGR